VPRSRHGPLALSPITVCPRSTLLLARMPTPLPVSPSTAARSPRFGLIVCVILLALVGCSRQEGTSPGAPAAKAQGVPPPPVPVTVIDVQPQRIPIVLETIGQTEGSKAVEVRARVAGILEKVLYKEGDRVQAGARMFLIERAPYEHALEQARAQVAQDQARIEQYRRDVDRLRPLAEERAVSQKEYDDARSNLQLALASIAQSQARVKDAELNLSYTVVTAPVSGVTGRSEKTVGNLVTTDANGSLLTTINQLDPIWVSFAFAQSDLAKLPGGRIGSVEGNNVTLVRADGTVYPQKGRVNFAATQIDLRQGTQQMRAQFPNAQQQLLPGEFVRVRLAAGERDNVFLVPQAAVVQTEKNYLVFVVEDGKAAARPVTTGDWYGSNWIILSGLKPGDRVIVDNLVKVRPGAAVTAQVAQNAATAQGPAPATKAPGGYGGANTPQGQAAGTPTPATGTMAQPGVKPPEQRENASPRGGSTGSEASGSAAAPK
jgi:membrane fusion protein, multidrug efflux system